MIYPEKISITVEDLEETPSTNSYLAELCKSGNVKEFYTISTDKQTAGRGQRGNSWESEAGKNLTFSTVFYPTALEAKNQFYLSMAIAAAVICTLKEYTDGFSIKWPNDIYWKDKKIGGILIENELEGGYLSQSIVGIGINVNQKVFHSSAPNPVSLTQITETFINRRKLLENMLNNSIKAYFFMENKFDEASLIITKTYQNFLYRREGLYPYRDAQGEFMAEIHEIEPSGHLILKDESENLRRYAFKEVEFIIP